MVDPITCEEIVEASGIRMARTMGLSPLLDGKHFDTTEGPKTAAELYVFALVVVRNAESDIETLSEKPFNRGCTLTYKAGYDRGWQEAAGMPKAEADFLLVPIPEPGTNMAKVMIANRLLRADVARLTKKEHGCYEVKVGEDGSAI